MEKLQDRQKEEQFPQRREVLFQEKGKVLDRKANKWPPLY